MDLFFAFFQRVLKRKANVLKMLFLWTLSRFSLFVLLKTIQSQFKTVQPQFNMKENSCFEEGKVLGFVKVWLVPHLPGEGC